MPFVIFARQLRKNCSCRDSGTVCLQLVGLVVVREDKDRGRCDEFLELCKGILFRGSPCELYILLGEIKQRASVVREIRNESLEEVSEA
jgi:hypothetical protein